MALVMINHLTSSTTIDLFEINSLRNWLPFETVQFVHTISLFPSFAPQYHASSHYIAVVSLYNWKLQLTRFSVLYWVVLILLLGKDFLLNLFLTFLFFNEFRVHIWLTLRYFFYWANWFNWVRYYCNAEYRCSCSWSLYWIFFSFYLLEWMLFLIKTSLCVIINISGCLDFIWLIFLLIVFGNNLFGYNLFFLTIDGFIRAVFYRFLFHLLLLENRCLSILLLLWWFSYR